MRIRRLFKISLLLVLGFLALVVLGIAALAGRFFVEHKLSISLPAATGPFAVGRVQYDWTDANRIDPLAPAAGTRREITVWVWYPAEKSEADHHPRAAYLPPPWAQALAGQQGWVMSELFTRDPESVHLEAIDGASLSPRQSRYPVVLFKPGIGALAADYSTFCQDLASHGYVVVASDSPYSTFIVVYNDGRAVTRTPQGNPGDAGHTPAAIHLAETLVPIWAADLKFELDQMQQLDDSDPDGRFTHRLDLQNVGVFGHSFGGAAALRFCRDDPRCRAGIDIDGIPFGSAGRGGMSKPFLFLLGEHGGEAGSGEILAQFHAIERGLPNQPNEITLAGARHFNFSDMALLKEHLLGRVSGLLGPIDARRGLAASADCVSAFFDTYLKHQPDALRGGRPGYPEVRVAPAGVQ